ncbi:MAG: hypothetical protein KAY24_18260 [Candidatus Eisenbacteria sp.]|nr:hypothetical protein [Candidatus Eisenbacteria bacterium]
MHREFVVTRTLLGFTGLVLAIWVVWSFLGDRPMKSPGPGPADESPSPPPIVNMGALSWEEELLSPEIQALWRERRLLLADLSRRYREEADSARSAIIRRDMERVIALAEREVNDLRNARRGGDADTNGVRSE